MKKLNELQKFINKHSKFTDSLIINLQIINQDKFDTVIFTIKPRFDNYCVKVTLDEVIDMQIESLYKFCIWELELKKDNGYYIFNPSPIASDFGKIYFKAKQIDFEEIKKP